MPLLLPLLLQVVSVTAGASSEGRFRTVEANTYEDLALTGRLELDVGFRRTSWSLSYTPTVTQFAIGTPSANLNLNHSLGLVSRLQLSKSTVLSLTENATYGERNFRQTAVSAPVPTVRDGGASGADPAGSATATPTPGPSSDQPGGSTVLAVPGDRTIRFGSLTTGVGLQHTIAKNWSSGASASYSLMGELETYDPPGLPRRRTYQADLRLSHLLGKADTVTVSTGASYLLTEPSAISTTVSAASTYRHILTRQASMSLSGSVNYVDVLDRLGNRFAVVLPGAGGTLSASIPVQPRPSTFTGFLSANLVPRVDYQYGGVSNGMSSNAGLVWNRNRLVLQAAGEVWHSLDRYGATAALAIYGLTESVAYGLDRRGHWLITAGSRQAKQSFSSGQDMPLTWVGFVSISYTTGPLRL